MTTLREAAQRALEALEYGHFAVADQAPHAGVMAYLEATDKLRAALEQQAKHAETYDSLERYTQEIRTLLAGSANRQPLTNGEIYTAYITATNQTLRPQDERLAFAFARAIEREHGIGGKE